VIFKIGNEGTVPFLTVRFEPSGLEYVLGFHESLSAEQTPDDSEVSIEYWEDRFVIETPDGASIRIWDPFGDELQN
jgi:hypothetical protein